MDVQATLLELATTIERATNWWLGATAAFVNRDLTPEQKAEYRAMFAEATAETQHRVDYIRQLADECPTDVRAKLYQAATKLEAGSGEGVSELLNEAAAKLSQSELVESTNDDRDAWMYQEKKARKTHGQIRLALAKEHSEWDAIESDQAVGQAIDRYCERKGFSLLRRKQK